MMGNVREYLLGTAGGFLMIGALSFVPGLWSEGSEALFFGLFASTGIVLLFAGLLMGGDADRRNVRVAACLVVAVGAVVFLVSAASRWDPLELLILVTCGAYGVLMYALSIRMKGCRDDRSLGLAPRRPLHLRPPSSR